ncbi:AlpA family phage regulatory protein [Bradyrhizobium sp. Leo170]|uniref:helix-turn-helix transcriptional regulator n=1 Tax=Bradyrhizobium sp. Leo170 TaxID=1571199 RepID=UPI00102E746F|nr:AlpA family phage regulatory protein [Bradyrhizobium sp. Leo170]TAI63411.1 AlpA family transcriptional regulator [Bradyrhizobium sp. Leo170]
MKKEIELEKYIRPSQLIKERFVPFSAPTLWRKVKNGKFPQPVKINGVTAWPLSVIRAWQQQVSGGAAQEAA